jgi:hypothetical protein
LVDLWTIAYGRLNRLTLLAPVLTWAGALQVVPLKLLCHTAPAVSTQASSTLPLKPLASAGVVRVEAPGLPTSLKLLQVPALHDP